MSGRYKRAPENVVTTNYGRERSHHKACSAEKMRARRATQEGRA